MACALSHITLWRQLLDDKKNEFYIVLEDDVFNSDLNFLCNNLELEKYDLIRLSGTKIRYNKKLRKLTKKDLFMSFHMVA